MFDFVHIQHMKHSLRISGHINNIHPVIWQMIPKNEKNTFETFKIYGLIQSDDWEKKTQNLFLIKMNGNFFTRHHLKKSNKTSLIKFIKQHFFLMIHLICVYRRAMGKRAG